LLCGFKEDIKYFGLHPTSFGSESWFHFKLLAQNTTPILSGPSVELFSDRQTHILLVQTHTGGVRSKLRTVAAL
jgi:hypothetical protein